MVTLSHIKVKFQIYIYILYCIAIRIGRCVFSAKWLIWDHLAYSLTRPPIVTVSHIQETRHD
jgi:hypothetical protein